ncbi:MAG: DUF4426 domain-containing protein [Arhodomonas sp.]|nr:DUF4426 domain-containing protein [Arhodomonas sp.]
MAVARVLAVVLAVLLSLPVQAQRSERFGAVEIHYNAVPTATLQPEVARAYDVVRSRNRALVTVSVLREGRPVAAEVTARAENEAGQAERLRLREVREEGAVYYIADARVRPPETLDIELRIRPRDGGEGPIP